MALDPRQVPPALQFEHAEFTGSGTGKVCVACKQTVPKEYFHAQGQVVCPLCADRIQSGQQAPPATSLVTAALYGAGAALGGCILYAAVSMLLYRSALVAILIGFLVGKAVRYGSAGRGGRPQQILAVVLTYFAITTSYIAVFLWQAAPTSQQVAAVAMKLLLLAAAAPFLSLQTGAGGIINLVIMFFALSKTWQMTARREILIMGPYEAAPTA